MQPYAWTDPRIVAGVTAIERLHLLELRMALDGVYDAVEQRRPAYTDAALDDGTRIKALHVNELRRAVVALE